jgi:hypothetical protein
MDLVVNGNLSADLTSDLLDCSEKRFARFTCSAGTTGTPVQKIKLYGSDDPRVLRDRAADLYATVNETAQWTPLRIPLGAVHGSGFTTPTDTVTEVDWAGTTALNLWMNLENPPKYLRLVFDNQSGGTANTSLKVSGVAE